jgi:hypothetical protein
MLIRILAFVSVLVCLPVASVGCSQPVVPVSVIATAQGVAQTAATVVADAQAVWPIVYAAIPASAQPAAQSAFNSGLLTANHAILALDDAIAAAVAANTPNPDFTAVFSQVAAAVGQIVSIVQQFMVSPAAPSVRSVNGVDVIKDMGEAVVRLKAAR